MATTRERIRMTEAEIGDFLAGPHKMQLATIQPDGTPHLVTMYYAMFDGVIGFWTYRTSQKARNLERDPRCTVLVEAGEGYDNLHGVQIGGTVERIEDTDRIREIGTAVYGRYIADFTEELQGYLEPQARKRWGYLLHPQRTSSWDHRKLAAAMASGS
jgi:PPOX class probable F420-dependent enzyme